MTVCFIERLHILLELCVNALQERAQPFGVVVASRIVNRLELGSINGYKFPAKEIQLSAKQVELPEDRLKSLRIVLSEIRDGLEVRRQLAHQPDKFQVAPALAFQTPA